VPVETEISVVFETSKVATSAGPFGIVGGIQFVAVFQSPVSGVALQVALPAYTVESASSYAKKKARGFIAKSYTADVSSK